MKLEPELRYLEQYLPTPRHRKLRTREVTEPYVVEIKEASSGKAPVVLRTHDLKRYCDGIQPTDYRQYNGELYTPVRVCDMLVPENNEEGNKPFPTERFAASASRYLRNDYNLPKDEAIKQLQENADRYLIVDGALWERTGEPMYQVCTFGLGHNHGGTALMITNHFNPNCRWTDYFTALQQEEAIAAAVKTALARGDDQSVEYIQNKRYYIEVLDPSVVRRDPKAWGGKGDDFLNMLDDITSSAGSSMEAGLLAVAFTGAEIRRDGEKKPSLADQIVEAEQETSGSSGTAKENTPER